MRVIVCIKVMECDTLSKSAFTVMPLSIFTFSNPISSHISLKILNILLMFLSFSFPFTTLSCHDLANWLSHYLYFFSFLIYNYKMERRKVSCDFVTMSQFFFWCDGWSRHRSQVTVGHMTSVIWGPWESKHIATVVKCISSREMSKNSIKFSLSNSEQRDSWLNSSHRTLDADISGSPNCALLPLLFPFGIYTTFACPISLFVSCFLLHNIPFCFTFHTPHTLL